MTNKTYEINGKVFVRCNKCLTIKELCLENWYPNKKARLGFHYPCKECIKAHQRTEEVRAKCRVSDKIRYQTNPKRHAECNMRVKKALQRNQEINPLWRLNHTRADKLIERLGIRPDTCPICGREGKIMAHHPDINKWDEIVFCCQICHYKIHHGKIKCPSTKKLLNPNKVISCECEDE